MSGEKGAERFRRKKCVYVCVCVYFWGGGIGLVGERNDEWLGGKLISFYS